MKKKFKYFFVGLQSIFYFFFKKIDKYILVPLTKLYIYISNLFENNSKTIESILSKKRTLIFISMFLALGLFLVVDSKIIVLVENSAEVLYNQPVTSIYNTENYIIEGLPETVDVTLIGSKADLYFAKQLPTQDITIDLSNLNPGSHTVTLRYNLSLTGVDYKLDPSEALIVVYPKLTESRDVSVDVLNENKLDSKLNIENIKLQYNGVEKNSVTIKGAEKTLKTVATVKALVDINKLAKQETGDILLTDVLLVAYDEYGQVVNVEFDVSDLTAIVTISSDYKEVPIKVIPSGSLVLGKAISSFETSVKTVTIYASKDVLNTITEIPVVIDVDNVKEDKEYNVVLEKIDGVRYMDESTVNVKMTVDDEVMVYVDNVTINHINLPSSFRSIAKTLEDTKTTIIVRGSASVIDTIDKTAITAYVDLSSVDSASDNYQTPVYVMDSDEVRVTFEVVTTMVELKISEN